MPTPAIQNRLSLGIPPEEASGAERNAAMLKRVMDTAAYLLFPRPVYIRWLKRNPSSWMGRQYPGPLIKLDVSPLSERIEQLAVATHEMGAQPLWSGYGAK